jgi:hypothetical protein
MRRTLMSDSAFIIHATADQPFARQLRANLREAAIKARTAEDLIAPGAEFSTQLERIIRRSPVVLVVLSKVSAERPWVATEISLALSQQMSGEPKLIIPVLAREDAEVPFFIRNLQYLDLSSSTKYRSGLPKLIESIKTWRASDQPRHVAEQSRRRLIDAERLALEQAQMEREISRHARTSFFAASFATMVGVVTAVFAAVTSLEAFNVRWTSAPSLYVFGAGAISGGIFVYLVSIWRRRFDTEPRGDDK